jgi:hypothetical protein
MATARLEKWYMYGSGQLAGLIYDDSRKRWPDGTWVRTSQISQEKQEDFEKGDVVDTMNSSYELGEPA